MKKHVCDDMKTEKKTQIYFVGIKIQQYVHNRLKGLKLYYKDTLKQAFFCENSQNL